MFYRRSWLGFGVWLLCAFLCLPTPHSHAADKGLLKALQQRFSFEGASSSVVVYDLDEGSYVFNANADLPLKPASILKVLTSFTAFRELGAEYRFTTRAYASDIRSGYTDTLVVKGGGDPSFTTEDLWVLARKVKARGIDSVGKVVLDDTLFADPKPRSGQRAYEAGSSALPLNFNSLAFDVCPGRAGQAAKLTAEPWEAGVVINGNIATSGRGRDNYFIEDAGGSLLQTFRARGRIGVGGKCREVYRSVPNPTRYFGKVFEAFLNYLDIRVVNGFEVGEKPAFLQLVYEHKSKPLNQIIRDLNHYSSNFIAEQLLSTLGCGLNDTCSRRSGIDRMESSLRKQGFPDQSFKIEDGSGLSHDNRLTAKIVLRLLVDLYHNNSFGPEFLLSLPVGARSGTLKSRRFGDQIVVRAKTGTLTGVNSLAGYVTNKSGRKYAFVIIQNKVSSASKAHSRERSLVRTLYES